MTEELPLPTPPEALLDRLQNLGIAYTLHHHKPVFTCEESAFLKDTIHGLHVKNLFLKDKKDRMALVVAPDEQVIDLKALAPLIGLDRISFGSADRLWRYLGVRPGSVNPFCAINDHENKVRVFFHKSIADAPVVYAHPMLNTMSVGISGPDLVKFMGIIGHAPELIDLDLAISQNAA